MSPNLYSDTARDRYERRERRYRRWVWPRHFGVRSCAGWWRGASSSPPPARTPQGSPWWPAVNADLITASGRLADAQLLIEGASQLRRIGELVADPQFIAAEVLQPVNYSHNRPIGSGVGIGSCLCCRHKPHSEGGTFGTGSDE